MIWYIRRKFVKFTASQPNISKLAIFSLKKSKLNFPKTPCSWLSRERQLCCRKGVPRSFKGFALAQSSKLWWKRHTKKISPAMILDLGVKLNIQITWIFAFQNPPIHYASLYTHEQGVSTYPGSEHFATQICTLLRGWVVFRVQDLHWISPYADSIYYLQCL